MTWSTEETPRRCDPPSLRVPPGGAGAERGVRQRPPRGVHELSGEVQLGKKWETSVASSGATNGARATRGGPLGGEWRGRRGRVGERPATADAAPGRGRGPSQRAAAYGRRRQRGPWSGGPRGRGVREILPRARSTPRTSRAAHRTLARSRQRACKERFTAHPRLGTLDFDFESSPPPGSSGGRKESRATGKETGHVVFPAQTRRRPGACRRPRRPKRWARARGGGRPGWLAPQPHWHLRAKVRTRSTSTPSRRPEMCTDSFRSLALLLPQRLLRPDSATPSRLLVARFAPAPAHTFSLLFPVSISAQDPPRRTRYLAQRGATGRTQKRTRAVGFGLIKPPTIA